MTVIKLARDLYKSQAVSNTSAAAGVIWEREMLRLGIGASLFRLPEASFHRSLDELRVITSHLRWISQGLACHGWRCPQIGAHWHGVGAERTEIMWRAGPSGYNIHTKSMGPWQGNHPHARTRQDRVVPEIWTNSPFRGSEAHAPR